MFCYNILAFNGAKESALLGKHYILQLELFLIPVSGFSPVF